VTKQIMQANMRMLGSDDPALPPLGAFPEMDDTKGASPMSSGPSRGGSGDSSTSWGLTRPWRMFRQSTSTSSSMNQYGQLQDRVSGIAWRISLYPIALVFINTVRTVGDIYFNDTIDEATPARGTIVLYVIYRVVNSGRGIILALVCPYYSHHT
jgi:hypothetical protein